MIAHLFVALGLVFPLVGLADSPTSDEGPSLRWNWDGERMEVDVLGLDAANILELDRPGRDLASWSALLIVGVDSRSGPIQPMAGRYHVEEQTLRFTPHFPTDRDAALVARLDLSRLPRPLPGPVRTARITLQRPAQHPTTRVVRVDPTPDLLPENLLKFYLHFSAPMSRGEAYRRVQIQDEADRPLKLPFLEVGEELWDADGTRLTLLLDPGRIKRGLVPHEEDGPILVAGRSYTLTIDRAWPDAEGRPLVEGVRKRFRTGPIDQTQPDPTTWTLDLPIAGGRGLLAVAFPKPLDQAMLNSALVVVGPDGRPVVGRVEVETDGAGWSFRPEARWRVGDYRVKVNPDLEDLVGNSIARPFEVDIARPVEPPARVGSVVLPFTVRERERSPGRG